MKSGIGRIIEGCCQLWALIALFLVMACQQAGAAEVIPPFVIEGTIASPVYNHSTWTVEGKRESNFWFSYSNGWWQVEINYPDAEKGTPSVHSCMKIPEGVRSYTLFAGKTNEAGTSAIACPTPFPAPGRRDMFAAWISFCPYPELPLIDGKRMRRFLNLPNCSMELFNDPRNEGTYSVKYLGPQKAFLSELSITNNGYYIELMEEIRRFPTPFENGFWEFQYEVLQTTNINGMTFPLKSVVKLGGIRAYGRTSMLATKEVSVKRISFSANDVAQRRKVPARLHAYDYRPADLEKGDYKSYTVNNDEWKPVPHPVKYFQITNMIGFYRGLESAGGISFCQGVTNTSSNLTMKFKSMKHDELQNVVRNFFIAVGVGLDSVNPENVGKSVTFNPDTRTIKVQATKEEIDIVARTLEIVEQQGK